MRSMRDSGAGRWLLHLKRWCWILSHCSIDILSARHVHIENTGSVAKSVSLRLSGFADCDEVSYFVENPIA
jgi:hypothetical protein